MDQSHTRFERVCRCAWLIGQTVEAHYAIVGLNHSGDDRRCRRLTGAVFADEANHIAWQYGQRYAIEYRHPAVFLDEADTDEPRLTRL